MENNNTTSENLTSENLTKLNQELDNLLDVPQTLERKSKEFHEANKAISKKYAEIDAEEAKIRKEMASAKLAEARNAKLAEATQFVNDAITSGDLTELINRLVNGGSHAKKAVDSDGTAKPAGERGATSKAIVARFVELTGTGMSSTDAKKQIVSEGFSRGTTGAAVLAYEIESGIKS